MMFSVKLALLYCAAVTVAPLLLLAQIPVSAQAIPSLMQGSPYISERKKLLSAGWQKSIQPGRNCDAERSSGGIRNGFERTTCFKYQELESCSNSGFCAFRWLTANGQALRIITHGEEYLVQSWSFENE
jgi:hypothetical protein